MSCFLAGNLVAAAWAGSVPPPDDLAEADSALSSARVAESHRDWGAAAAYLRGWADRHPNAAGRAEVLLQLALDVGYAGSWDEAAEIDEQLADDPKWGYLATYRACEARAREVMERWGPFDAPRIASVAEIRVSTGGVAVERLVLPSDIQAYFDAIDRLAATSSPSAASDLQYGPAQLLYALHRYPEFRERAARLLADSPRDRADWAVGALVVHSYEREGDLVGAEAAKWDILTVDGVSVDERWMWAAELSVEYEYEAAARLYEELAHDPSSQGVDRREALLEAIRAYGVVVRWDDAERLRAEYVERYPDDLQTVWMRFDLAESAEERIDLVEAMAQYRAIVASKASAENLAAATYDVGFLARCLGDHRAAAESFERYGREFPSQSDAEDVRFLAGEEWERVGPTSAVRFYEDARVWASDPNHVLLADARSARLYRSLGDAAHAAAATRRLALDWTALAPGRAADLQDETRHEVAAEALVEVAAGRGAWVSKAEDAASFGDFDYEAAVAYRSARGIPAALDMVLDDARGRKRWSEWDDRALADLHEIDPDQWPSTRAEIRETVTAESSARVLPLAMDPGATEP